MSVINNDLLLATDEATGYNLSKSLRFRSSASAYLSRTPASAGNRRTFTYSTWIKRGTLSSRMSILDAYSASAGHVIEISSGDTIEIYGWGGGAAAMDVVTTQVFRDPAAWYHIVVAIDTTQATASNRIKVYVNGSQVTSFSTATYPSQNSDLYINNTVAHNLGRRGDSQFYLDGYKTEVNFIDGQQLTPSSFGENNATTGVWQPKRYTGTYGTNGFYLPFTNTSSTTTLGYDFSGNSNNWTTNNISLTAGSTYDSMTDVPTLTSATTANYAVLNCLSNNSNAALSNGNLTVYTAGNYINFTASTIAIAAGGKYYWEQTCQTNTGSGFYQAAGIWSTRQWTNYDTGVYTEYYMYNAGGTFNNGAGGSGSYGATWTNGDVIGVALDMTAGTITFYKNGTSQGVASTTINTSLSYFVNVYTYTTQASLNFGQRPFAYTPPTGYVALNTYNLPDSTIKAGNTVMDATTFNSNILGASVVNSGFKPDLVWMKARSNARNHELIDSCRGGAYTLFANLTNAEASDTRISSFNSNGFTYTTNSNSANIGETDVAWQWQAGQGTTSSNTNGSITSTVSVNATAGFSVVTYSGNNVSGATIGHGLGVAPAFFIVKNRSAVSNWTCYHQSLGNTYGILLNSTNAADANTYWMNTSPTSTVFKVDSFGGLNASGNNYVAYCWAEVAGFSKFGSYTGNGSSDGPFIYTGFRPRYIMIKATSSVGYGYWMIHDTARGTYNVVNQNLYANYAYGEDTDAAGNMDILSNGFKLRGTVDNANGNGSSYIYMAFAENPFKNSLAR